MREITKAEKEWIALQAEGIYPPAVPHYEWRRFAYEDGFQAGILHARANNKAEQQLEKMVESHQKRVERIKELEAEVARLKEDGSEAQRMYYQLKRDVQSSVQKPDDDIIPEDYYIK